jgi:polysaccharide export outer membrane protein
MEHGEITKTLISSLLMDSSDFVNHACLHPGVVDFHIGQSKMIRLLACLIVVAVTCGCSAIDGLLDAPVDNQVLAAEERSPPPIAVAGWTGRTVPNDREVLFDGDDSYVLDTGDRLRIFVYGQPNLSRIYPVDQSGLISVPLIGLVKARGLTSQRLAHIIRNRLAAQYVKEPEITVDIAQHRPFYVLGEVRTAGQYPYAGGLTVRSAVATAGGFSERANERVVQITRRAGGITEKFDAPDEFVIQPGDTIYVYERFL